MKLNGCIFLLMTNSMNLIIISGVKHANVLKGNLRVNPQYNNQFLKTKMKSGKYSTDFRGKDATEVGLNYIYIPIMLIGSVLEKDGKY